MFLPFGKAMAKPQKAGDHTNLSTRRKQQNRQNPHVSMAGIRTVDGLNNRGVCGVLRHKPSIRFDG